MAGQQHDVRRALPQRGQVDGQHCQPVVKVLAEASLGNEPEQVLVAGGHQAHIHLHRAVAAHRFDLPLLHRPEQLGLDGQGQIPHFIQEQAAAMGQPEFARTGVVGAGKGPPHVPEQLARGQRLRQGGAVEALAGLAPGRPQGKKGHGHQLFAGAGLPREQNGEIRCRRRWAARTGFPLNVGLP